ncbi:MAG: hypothetical protein ABIO92_10980 [Chloroflexia bacterium]
MKKIHLFIAMLFAFGVAAMLGIIRPGGIVSAAPVRQGEDLVASSMAFADAYNAGDTAKMRQLADPAFQQVGGTGEKLDLNGFANSTSSGVRVTLSNCKLTGPNVVSCDTVLSGGPIPPLAHPWTETSVLTFANGKITRLDETLSAQTAQDLQALAAPGMPSTGTADPASPLVAILMALLLIACGGLTLKVISPRIDTR